MMAFGPITDTQILETVDPLWFWAQVALGSKDQCWPWTGNTDRNGYGCVRLSNGQRTRASRVAYLLGVKQPLGTLLALHHCDNPPCCNYQTCLFAGTHKDNSQDMANKGRGWGPKKLTDQQVAEIKQRYGNGEKAVALATEYKVDQRQIRRLANGTSRRRDSAPYIIPVWQELGLYKPDTKLTDAQVAELRARYLTKGITQRALAAIYGISQGHLSAIVSGKKRS